eukprot:5009160-Prymnesium_polylepis.1
MGSAAGAPIGGWGGLPRSSGGVHGLLLLAAAAGPRGGRPAWLLLPTPSPSTSQSACAGTPRRAACTWRSRASCGCGPSACSR